MTKLVFSRKPLFGKRLQAPSPFPPLRKVLGSQIKSKVPKDDKLLLGYGLLDNHLPYTMQYKYDGAEEELEFETVILENENLRAEFIPALGGRLWSLFDKLEGRDLVFENSEFKVGNLAIRNAWVAGGVEWNYGRRGHDAATCSMIFTAVTEDDDGTPVLRFYDFQRDRAAIRQMDFFLPRQSKFLFARMRIVNPNDKIIPMYWWSNIAFPYAEGQRVIVPAETTYANTYVNEHEHYLEKKPMPFNEGIDCTRPENYWSVKDHFFNLAEKRRKFEAVFFSDGYGLMHSSTDFLQGRKLFVWGLSPGGENWQRRLTGAGQPGYIEIQAGICKTQFECMPMPARAKWEWLEAYGAMRLDPAEVDGDWDNAVEASESGLEALLPRQSLDRLLERTGASFAEKPGRLLFAGEGWGALENLRRAKQGLPALDSHLDFGQVTEEQSDWQRLLETGEMPAEPTTPKSFMVQEEWFELLQKAPANANSLYHLAINYFSRDELEQAEECARAALALKTDAFRLHLLANILRAKHQAAEGAIIADKALEISQDEFLLVDIFKNLLEAQAWHLLLRRYDKLSPDKQKVPMLRFLRARALMQIGEPEKALAILEENGGIQIPDIREGETSLAELYISIQLALSRKQGENLLPEEIAVPGVFDLRMTVPRKDN
jgi:tetratricopeptide (TPR) repeat protein